MAGRGLVLEGGAMRGMFTCGVLDVLMENGIVFDGAGGVSAGAVFGCNFKSRQIGRGVRYNRKYCSDLRYASLRSLLKTGDYYGADFCYRTLPDELDVFDRDAFRADPTVFYIGATDAATGEAVWHTCTDGGAEDLLWMRASASMPVFARAVEIGGRAFYDGGIAAPTPYRYMESLGYRRCVVVLTQPADYRKAPNRLAPALRLLLRRYPRLVETIAARHERYNAHMAYIRERERAGEALVICPPGPLRIGFAEKDPAELERVYRCGRAEAERRLDAVRAFLGDEKTAGA